MKIYNSISELIKVWKSLDWDASLYLNKDLWAEDPFNTPILFLDADDEEQGFNEDDQFLPLQAKDRSMEIFFDVQTFQDIMQNQEDKNIDSSLDEYITAINHYSEYDTFK